MTRDVEEMLARARDVFERIPVTPEQTQARIRQVQRGVASFGRRLRRAFLVTTVAAIAVVLWGLFGTPIGIGGFLLAMILLPLIFLATMLLPGKAPPKPAQLTALPPAALPRSTEMFLESRRRALPQLAAPQLDAIGARLATLEPQLQKVPANDPVAQDLQRLLGKHLPEFVDSYAQVPPSLRTRDMDQQLANSLSTIDTELKRASEALASGDKDAFLTRGRFLETRYGKDAGEA